MEKIETAVLLVTFGLELLDNIVYLLLGWSGGGGGNKWVCINTQGVKQARGGHLRPDSGVNNALIRP